MKLETAFSRQLCAKLQLAHPEAALQVVRVESNYTQQGIPDIYLCLRGASAWIETKVDNNPLEPLQIAWHKQHRNAGGLVFVVRRKVAKGGHIYYMAENDDEFETFNSLLLLVSHLFGVIEERRYA